jgi:hypothetical protein
MVRTNLPHAARPTKPQHRIFGRFHGHILEVRPHRCHARDPLMQLMRQLDQTELNFAIENSICGNNLEIPNDAKDCVRPRCNLWNIRVQIAESKLDHRPGSGTATRSPASGCLLVELHRGVPSSAGSSSSISSSPRSSENGSDRMLLTRAPRTALPSLSTQPLAALTLRRPDGFSASSSGHRSTAAWRSPRSSASSPAQLLVALPQLVPLGDQVAVHLHQRCSVTAYAPSPARPSAAPCMTT